MRDDYPASLSKVKVPFLEKLWNKQDELNELNHPTYDVSCSPERLLECMQHLDEGTLSDEWYRGMTSIWFGILSAYPWDTCPSYEEEIWKLILEKHTEIKKGNLVFKYNPESKIDKWLRKHTSDGDTPINVETIIKHGLDIAIKKGDFWEFHEIDWTDDPEEVDQDA